MNSIIADTDDTGTRPFVDEFKHCSMSTTREKTATEDKVKDRGTEA